MAPKVSRRYDQVRSPVQESDVATQYSCTQCQISYYEPGRRPVCPLCDAYRQLDDMRKALRETQRRMEALYNVNERLKAQTDISYSIREATDLLDDHDLLFFKTVLYQWKLDRSVSLKITHSAPLPIPAERRIKEPKPNGFLVMPRGEEPYAHACTSMGGLAIAEYYEEALHTVGAAAAISLLLKGFAKLLPGVTE